MEAIKTITLNERPIDLSVLYHRIKELEQAVLGLMVKKLVLKIRTQEGVEIIPQDQIIRCQSDNNYTIIVKSDGSRICVSKTLKHIQSQLSSDSFVRVHASHLVCIDEVRRISTSQGKTLILSNGDRIPVSRSYHSSVEEIFS